MALQMPPIDALSEKQSCQLTLSLHENYSNEHHQVEDRQGQLLECSTAVRALPTVSFVYCDHHSISLTNLFYISQGK